MTPSHLRPVSPAAIATWSGLMLLGAVASVAAGLGAVIAVQLASLELPSSGLRWDLAVGLAVVAAAGIGAVALAYRVAFGQRPVVPVAALVIVAGCVVIAGTFELTLHAWANASAAGYDADRMMPTTLFSLVLVLTGISLFATAIVPMRVVPIPLAMAVLLLALLLGIAASNAGGAADGIRTESLQLAGTMASAVAFAVGAVSLVGVRSLRRRHRLLSVPR